MIASSSNLLSLQYLVDNSVILPLFHLVWRDELCSANDWWYEPELWSCEPTNNIQQQTHASELDSTFIIHQQQACCKNTRKKGTQNLTEFRRVYTPGFPFSTWFLETGLTQKQNNSKVKYISRSRFLILDLSNFTVFCLQFEKKKVSLAKIKQNALPFSARKKKDSVSVLCQPLPRPHFIQTCQLIHTFSGLM